MGRQAARHNESESKLFIERKKDVAERIREMRFLMGLSQKEVYDIIKINPGQYSRIETGELDGTRVLKYLEELLDEWKGKEIKRLQAKIKYIRRL
jgi:transcriptional regulator with XRE-family HTH domain